MVANTSAASSEVPEFARRLLRALPEAAILVSSAGEVLGANRSARQMLGLTAPASVPLEPLARDPDALRSTLRTWAGSTEPLPGALELRKGSGPDEAPFETFNATGCVLCPRADGRPALLLVHLRPRAEANPFLLLSQKLTELNDEVARRVQVEEALRRSEAALRERVLEAESLNRTKDEFLATVSHELRTPLNAILGWAVLLRERHSDPALLKGLEVIHRNAVAQETIIEDILDVSRVITGKFLLETQPCELGGIVEEAIEVVRPSAVAKEIQLIFSRPDEACQLVADPDRLRQVIWNLLSNAVKFTGRGGSVRIDLQREGSQFALAVTDSGKGIEPQFLPYVFDRFRQADSSTTRKSGGLGLGLSLVRHICELHGGFAEAESEGDGKGSTFRIRLPIRAVAPAAPTERPRPSRSPEELPANQSLEGLRVLVVDDEADARELLALVLVEAGAVVRTADSAGEALRAVGTFRPQVLVSDVGMPGEDGYALVRRLRALGPDQGGAIPAVAVTAYTREVDRLQALSSGFTTHVGKPVSPEALVAAVAHLALSAPQ